MAEVSHFLDLFDTHALPGLATADGIVTPDEEAALIRHIDNAGLTPFRFQQWTGKRLTRSFGWSYDFANGAFDAADPMPEWLLDMRERAALFTGLVAGDLAQALVIRYDSGAGIGWHKDRPVFEHVVGISLAAPATMRFRRRNAAKFDRASVPLVPRSLYHMCGEARHDWEHSIVEMDQPRWSVTFRSLSCKGQRLANQRE
ncbi:alpha-ketoglutarate-dependent dioxygenase AlkB [Sphingomonas bisphenolicum]|uniref:2OG-Fe(II) oxygenase n=1 Tax=Sphingomonas bisphenolicum TaxID=296544 RepID=A0ABM7FYL2_9SPHN|nr:alpha-ketoglutarate-dependent dioxygenase AlkB [Sphingomonas bisphenolicum]BBF68828.1 2OG-Fe(II) oxygenase [Sphingomonas bisphenolicum]